MECNHYRPFQCDELTSNPFVISASMLRLIAMISIKWESTQLGYRPWQFSLIAVRMTVDGKDILELFCVFNSKLILTYGVFLGFIISGLEIFSLIFSS